MKKTFILCAVILAFAAISYAQPRMIENVKKPTPAALAAQSFKAKYDGGMFGYNTKEEGTIKFDDANLQIIFFGKNNKELFTISYDAMNLIYPNSQSVQSTGGKVMQNVPLPGAGIAGMFMKEKRRYMVINFDDVMMKSKGTVNFKFENRELLEQAIQVIGFKAELKQRGDSFYR